MYMHYIIRKERSERRVFALFHFVCILFLYLYCVSIDVLENWNFRKLEFWIFVMSWDIFKFFNFLGSENFSSLALRRKHVPVLKDCLIQLSHPALL